MIVTYARTGSLRRVTPNANDGSSYGVAMSISGGRPAIASLASIGSIFARWVPIDQVDHRRSFQQRLAFLLRDASGDSDDRFAAGLAAGLFDLTESRVELVFGALADAAGVDDDQVRVVVRVGGIESRLFEQSRHPLGIVDVHLAAVRFDEVLHLL